MQTLQASGLYPLYLIQCLMKRRILRLGVLAKIDALRSHSCLFVTLSMEDPESLTIFLRTSASQIYM